MLSTHPDRIERIAANLELTVEETRNQINSELLSTHCDKTGYQNMTVLDYFELLGIKHQEMLDTRDYIDTCLHPEW